MNFTNLQNFDADIHNLKERVNARSDSEPHSSDNAPGQSSSLSVEPRFYISDPIDECSNALGHLADPWAVVRLTAHVGTAYACGLTGPSLNVQGGTQEAIHSCISIARLGSGDQTVVFPTPYAVTWLRNPGVYEMKLMKRPVAETPDDALMVQRLSVSRKGRAATPWALDHLGLPHEMAFDLQRVLASTKPVHQAVFMAAISRPDTEHKLTATAETDKHLLSRGIRAAMGLSTLDLSRDEASLARLACLLSDLGALQPLDQTDGLIEPGRHMPQQTMGGHGARCAHPSTSTYLQALLNRFAELEPEDASALQGLLGSEANRTFRIGSKDGGPFSDQPADPVLARMGCAMGDALSHAPAIVKEEAQARDDQGQPATKLNNGPCPEHGPGDASDGASSRIQELPAAIRPQIDQQRAGESTETAIGEEGSTGRNALAILPLATQVPSPDDLRIELDRFDDDEDAPRPSLAWAAGMLDGDGCIAIVRQPYPNRSTIYRLTVSVCQNCLQTLEHFRRSVGVHGVIYAVKRKLEHNKQVYTLNYSGPKALLVILRLRSLLVRKRPEALVAMSFCLHGQISRRFGPHGVPTSVEAVRVAHYLKLRALK